MPSRTWRQSAAAASGPASGPARLFNSNFGGADDAAPAGLAPSRQVAMPPSAIHTRPSILRRASTVVITNSAISPALAVGAIVLM
jgi:hypothetical protein